LINFFAQLNSKPPHPFPELTEREREVLDLLARRTRLSHETCVTPA